jgi:hypothetical protein
VVQETDVGVYETHVLRVVAAAVSPIHQVVFV